MILFCADLDNTLIYSYKHNIGQNKKCIELYQGHKNSFITRRSYALLKQLQEHICFVPTTTRTVEQYQRIHLGITPPSYALTCNGGVLLINGIEDINWYQESLSLIADCEEEMKKAKIYLENDAHRNLAVKNIRNLFLFTKSECPACSAAHIQKHLNPALTEVFVHGNKLYVIPTLLSKGMAVKRLQARFHADTVISAGDSEMDISMLMEADIAIAPESLITQYSLSDRILKIPKNTIFSDALLQYILTTFTPNT